MALRSPLERIAFEDRIAEVVCHARNEAGVREPPRNVSHGERLWRRSAAPLDPHTDAGTHNDDGSDGDEQGARHGVTVGR
jgi:hypothetical protein